MKKLLTLAVLAASVGMTALPAGAVTQTGNITVKWNLSVTAGLTLTTNYSAAGAQQLTAPAILASSGNAASSACQTSGIGSEVASTVTFADATHPITPDSALVKNTDCLYKNAINAAVLTNSTNWSLGEYATAALPAGSTLCSYSNGFASYPATVSGAASVSQSGRAAYADTTSCAAGGVSINTTVNSTNLATSTTAYSSTPANVGQDLGLLLSPAAATGAGTVTVTLSLLAS